MDSVPNISKIFILIWFFCIFFLAHSVVIELESLECTFNEKILKNMTIRLISQKNRKVVNGSVIPAIDLHKFMFNGVLKVVQKNGRTFNIFNRTLDGCESLAQTNAKSLNIPNLLFKDVRNIMKNVPSKCPWEKDREVFVENFFIDIEKWPVYIPLVQFQHSITMTHRGTVGFVVLTNGNIRTSPKKPRRKG